MLRRSKNPPKITSHQDPSTPSDPRTQAELAQIKHTLNFYKRVMYGVVGVVVVGLLGSGAAAAYQHFSRHRSPPNPVPLTIRSGVNFAVYYPEQAKLPAGYTLDMKSFKITSDNAAVLYAVNYAGNQKLHFAVQQKPSAPDLQSFYAKNLPIHNTVKTSVGTAAVGVIGNQAFVSLPTNGNDWIIITGPPNTDQAKLTRVLQAIKAPDNKP